MSGPASFLFWASSMVWLVCFVFVLIAIYQNGSPGLAIGCAVLSLLFGVGALAAFVLGWMRSAEWGIAKIMLIWTIAFIIAFVCYYIAPLPFTRSDLPDV